MGKQAKHAFPQNAKVSNLDLAVIHSDVWITKAPSLGGCHYYMRKDHVDKSVEI